MHYAIPQDAFVLPKLRVLARPTVTKDELPNTLRIYGEVRRQGRRTISHEREARFDTPEFADQLTNRARLTKR